MKTVFPEKTIWFGFLFISAFFLIFIGTTTADTPEQNQTIQDIGIIRETPDLTLSNLIFPDEVKTGETVEGSVIVRNTGPVPATQVLLDVVLIPRESKSGSTIWIGTRAHEFVEPGLQGKIPLSVTIPKGISEGEYIVQVSIKGDKTELFPDDNTIKTTKPIQVSTGEPWKGEHPNLKIKIQSVDPSQTAPGSPLTIDYTIQNTNNQSAGSYHTGFFLTADPDISSQDYRIWDEVCYATPYSQKEEHISIDLIPDTIPFGTYYLGAVVDYTGMIAEADETDNVDIYPDPITIGPGIDITSREFADKISGALFLKTNKYRSYLGLPELVYDNNLSTIAYDHTLDMMQRNYFSHYTPEGLDPADRAQTSGYDTTRILENGTVRTGIAENIIRIASGHTVGKAYSGFVDPTTPEDIADVMMLEWIHSPEHNKNLINPTVKKIGVGTGYNGEYFYATEDFY